MPLDPDKVFMFPESYNELRKELVMHWASIDSKIPNLWAQVGWYMAFDMVEFMERMNDKLGGVLTVVPITKNDELRTDVVCKVFLKELRKRRGEVNP